MNRTMTRTARRDVERRLIDTPAGEPPEGLLERLRAEVPERPEVAPAPARRLDPPIRRRLAAAAVVVLAVGGAWVLWRLSGQVVRPDAERRAAVPGAAVASDASREADGERAGGDGPFADRVAEEPAASGPFSGESASAESGGPETAGGAAAPLDLSGAPDPRSGTSRGGRPGAAGAAAPPRSEEPSAPGAEPRERRQAAAADGGAAAPVPQAAPSPAPPAPGAAAVFEQPAPRGEAAAAPSSRPPRRHEASAHAPGAGTAVQRAAPAPRAVPTYARLDSGIEVTVFHGGSLLPNTEVSLLAADGSRRRGRTGEDGRVRFADVEPGRYRVVARSPAAAASATVAVDVPGVGRRDVPAVVQLGGGPAASTGILQVTVRDPRRTPLPGATVHVSPQHLEPAVTGREGRVDLRLPPGRYRVTASLEGFADRTAEVVVPPAGDSASQLEIRLPLLSFAEEVVVTGLVEESEAGRSAALPGAPAAERRRVGAAAKAPAPPPPAAPAQPRSPRQVLGSDDLHVTTSPSRTAPTGGAAAAGDTASADMFFRHSGVHPFVDTAEDRLSTFGLDVDTGSWGLVQAHLRRGQRPPAGAVRVEEVVNAFDYGDPAPARGETFRVTAEGAPSPFAPGADHRLLRFGLRARSVDPGERRPATLVFVVDVSGSMAQGGRLELVKESLGLLLDQLGPGDRVAVVVFSDAARVALEPTDDPEAARRAIAGLAPESSTNAEAGLALGYRLAWRERRPGTANRVLLLSDGVANVGATRAESILARAAGAAADGIELTTVGVGMGDYNDALLEQLADRGDGRYAYVDDVAAARRIFVEELAGTLETVAEEARVQVDFDPRVVARWRLLGYENRDIADERFRHDHSVDAGEIGAGHAVTALYEVRLAGDPAPSAPLAHLKLRWRDPESGRFRETERLLRVADLAPTWEAAPRSLRLAAVAAEFAEQLRGSEHAEGADPNDLARHARAVAADLPADERAAELAALAGRAARLAAAPRPRED